MKDPYDLDIDVKKIFITSDVTSNNTLPPVVHKPRYHISTYM